MNLEETHSISEDKSLVETLRTGDGLAESINLNNNYIHMQEQKVSLTWHDDHDHNRNNALTRDGDRQNEKRKNKNHKIEDNNNYKSATKDPNRLVVNLSNFELNLLARRLLEKGLNFAITLKKI